MKGARALIRILPFVIWIALGRTAMSKSVCPALNAEHERAHAPVRGRAWQESEVDSDMGPIRRDGKSLDWQQSPPCNPIKGEVHKAGIHIPPGFVDVSRRLR